MIESLEILTSSTKQKIIPMIPPKPEPELPSEEIYYRVICGAYKERSTANNLKAKLENEGYSGVWIQKYVKE